MLVAGKGAGEGVANGAAARPVVAARKGRPGRRETEKGKGERNGDEPEGRVGRRGRNRERPRPHQAFLRQVTT